jgi:hypothetical protein
MSLYPCQWILSLLGERACGWMEMLLDSGEFLDGNEGEVGKI